MRSKLSRDDSCYKFKEHAVISLTFILIARLFENCININCTVSAHIGSNVLIPLVTEISLMQ